MSVIIFLIILAVLILVHEFGHFIVAKKSGIRVDEFGLGFPPKIFSKKWGDTLYTLNLLPFGGFVKIFGEDSHGEPISENDKPTSFVYKPKWIQASVLAAGVFMNLLFAWLLISLGFMIGLPAGTEYSGFGEVSDVHVVVTEVIPDSPAQKAGLISGDTLVEVKNREVSLSEPNLTLENITSLISNTHSEITIEYIREDEAKEAVLMPTFNQAAGRNIIGIAMDELGTLRLPIHLAFLEGGRTAALLIKETAAGLGSFLWQSIQFKSDLSQVSGPIGIAGVVGEAKSLGFVYLLSLVALISINLAIINLLPFPALDGGRLFFLAIEAVIRREIPTGFVRAANFIGFVLLLILMVVVTGHDIVKLL